MTTKLSHTLNKSVIKRIDALARLENRSRSRMVEILISESLKQRDASVMRTPQAAQEL